MQWLRLRLLRLRSSFIWETQAIMSWHGKVHTHLFVKYLKYYMVEKDAFR